MHKIIEEQDSGWWIVWEDVGVKKLYLGSYKNRQSATQSHPNAKIVELDSD